MVVHISSGNFEEEVLKSNVPVLVDFFATWCGPCKMVGPIVEELAGEFEGKAKIAKLDIDQDPALAQQYKVMGVPTLMFFKNGEAVDKIVGAVPKAAIAEKLNSVL